MGRCGWKKLNGAPCRVVGPRKSRSDPPVGGLTGAAPRASPPTPTPGTGKRDPRGSRRTAPSSHQLREAAQRDPRPVGAVVELVVELVERLVDEKQVQQRPALDRQRLRGLGEDVVDRHGREYTLYTTGSHG